MLILADYLRVPRTKVIT